MAANEAWPVWGIAHGHGALVACAALYLVWWWLFFDPRRERPTGVLYGVGVACILGAVACGAWGVYRITDGLGAVDAAITSSGVTSWALPGWVFFVGGALVYVVALVVTNRVFSRQVTTELLLIVAWFALELDILDCLAGVGALTPGASAVLLVLVIALFAGSMVCYVLYYRLPPVPAFLDGCAPLVAVGVFSLAMAIVLSV
ncbi:MAG: hypothetical protein PHR15_05110 [Atopobiaceae bacterium]|jgi:hypothetical protein|nr:hypothetical protein [Atopobiaceae bacterium]MCH4179795.1 hypothetical protein [Atopobiaceae bacterium]MCH4213547.1 hypothetical protein [Atopobiaceae bacterium]MCH4229643.1 hypothetical protein [Atopobiaceae bacterium]MCH4276195.1 hypothetical protein [Atopobiaceae bacterium]